VGEQIAKHALVIVLVGKTQQVVTDVVVVAANVFFMLRRKRFPTWRRWWKYSTVCSNPTAINNPMTMVAI
jgi:hypothetical protein